MKSLALSVIILGVVLIVAGLILFFYNKIPFIGRLPGDIRITGENSSFYFPITSCIIISIILSLLLSFIGKFFK
ncbi:MAG TPA: DUF2905 domain-containing protein [Lentisphaeria bacterium]|nr:MAG: hypothetical protein A2X47_00495 [Lentisphaerae bacterium GWF2_38_69]HBM16876.1 DUF2905 domain-containing protein [Lentisphaeria bacterium]